MGPGVMEGGVWAKAEYICCCGGWLARWSAWAAAAAAASNQLPRHYYLQHCRYRAGKKRGAHQQLPAGAVGAGPDWLLDDWEDRVAEAPLAGPGL